MKIKIGEYDVFSEGTVVGNENEPIDFIFNEETGFIIRISFTTNSNLSEMKINPSKYDRNGAQMDFINFNSKSALGNSKPLRVGTFNDKDLFLNYRIYSIDKGGKSLQYTWLLRKEDYNG